MLTPQTMVETGGYMGREGLAAGQEALDATARAKKAREANPAQPIGTGADAALAAQAAALPAAEGGDPVDATRQKEKRSRSRHRKGSLEEKLERQEERRRAEKKRTKAERSKSPERGRSKKRKRGRDRRRDKSSSGHSSKSSRDSSGDSVFRSSSARGGDWMRVAKKKPGRLTEISLKEMEKYLAGQSERGLEPGEWRNLKVRAYLNQIVLSAHPPSKIGIRAHRELITLACVLDEMLASRYLQALDIVMQRFKAVEASIQDGNWNLARHYELIPAAGAKLSNDSERERAVRAEVRELKLKDAVEKDKSCRRLLKRCYPHAYIVDDIKQFKMAKLKSFVEDIGGVTGLIVGGCSPCQGLSRLSSERQHLDDERSALFFEASRVFRDAALLAEEKQMWLLSLLENVVPDQADLKAMNSEMGTLAYLVDAKYLSRSRRPRLFWLSTSLKREEDVPMFEKEGFTRVVYAGPVEPLDHFLSVGSEWEEGLRNEDARFPTFTRAIPRRKPPPRPVGLEGLEPAAKLRWEEHQYRYPPYTYADEFMVLDQNLTLRPLCADEREVLMGFKRGHTKKLWKKNPATEEERIAAEDKRCAAIGNAFHTNSVACLLDHALASMKLKQRKGVQAIVELSLESQGPRPKEPKEAELEGAVSEGEALFLPVKNVNTGGDDQSDDDVQSLFWGLDSETKATAALRTDVAEEEKKLAVQLVMAYIRRQEYRGSDVRLDIGSLYRADAWPRATVCPGKWHWQTAHAYRFSRPEHINLLELRTIIHTLEWRLRREHYGDCRSLRLSDSQVALAVSVKGRSSSRAINRLLKRYAALQVAGGVHPLLAWIESELNPADAPSRKYAQ
eukprot:Skav207124  [mRNA]  locus=scaffold1369:302986:308136:- [translate_table: standard]